MLFRAFEKNKKEELKALKAEENKKLEKYNRIVSLWRQYVSAMGVHHGEILLDLSLLTAFSSGLTAVKFKTGLDGVLSVEFGSKKEIEQIEYDPTLNSYEKYVKIYQYFNSNRNCLPIKYHTSLRKSDLRIPLMLLASTTMGKGEILDAIFKLVSELNISVEFATRASSASLSGTSSSIGTKTKVVIPWLLSKDFLILDEAEDFFKTRANSVYEDVLSLSRSCVDNYRTAGNIVSNPKAVNRGILKPFYGRSNLFISSYWETIEKEMRNQVLKGTFQRFSVYLLRRRKEWQKKVWEAMEIHSDEKYESSVKARKKELLRQLIREIKRSVIETGLAKSFYKTIENVKKGIYDGDDIYIRLPIDPDAWNREIRLKEEEVSSLNRVQLGIEQSFEVRGQVLIFKMASLICLLNGDSVVKQHHIDRAKYYRFHLMNNINIFSSIIREKRTEEDIKLDIMQAIGTENMYNTHTKKQLLEKYKKYLKSMENRRKKKVGHRDISAEIDSVAKELFSVNKGAHNAHLYSLKSWAIEQMKVWRK